VHANNLEMLLVLTEGLLEWGVLAKVLAELALHQAILEK
jgi:hypothetical protein